jgi:CubicO group peptidase (beta-lactamase class C family)
VRTTRRVLAGLLGTVLVLLLVWSGFIGPAAAWRVVTHGTTTVWDHLKYPGRALSPSPTPEPWPTGPVPLNPPEVAVDGVTTPLEMLLADGDALAFLVARDGALVYEWYAPDHSAYRPSMVFSVSKSIFSLLLGAAYDDGLFRSMDDPVTSYLPELGESGFDTVTLADLLRMDSSLDYVEDDNPFGIHVEFNYTPDLTDAILSLRVRDRPDPMFRYKSGDNAVLGLILDRVLGERSITDYLEGRLWNPLGATHAGVWSTDHEGGLERTWCCLALTASDLARFGQLILEGGDWRGERLLSPEWLTATFEPGFTADRWPSEYQGSPLLNYGYEWWLTEEAYVALGKGGQYLYVDPRRRVVIVRLGQTDGGFGWIDILRQVAEATGAPVGH